MLNKILFLHLIIIFAVGCTSRSNENNIEDYSKTTNLTELYHSWRKFETPPMRQGAPDYTAETFKQRMKTFNVLQQKLMTFDTASMAIPEKVDWYIMWAEMNGFDFNFRILQPWARDPAFYTSLYTERSDVPAHEGPTHHKTTEIWMYTFPLSESEKNRLIADLKIIEPLNEQAKINLTGNAKDLWIAGIRNIKGQVTDLQDILTKEGVASHPDLLGALDDAIKSTNSLVGWLEEQAKNKTGPSGIGKENYTWYLQNVHLVPMTWEDEVLLLKRELARAWSSLKLEEHRNRKLPPLASAESVEEYDNQAKKAHQSIMRFLEDEDIMTIKDYYGPAMANHLGKYVPKETRNFFWITAHYDPRPLYSHFYHWFELALMDKEPHRDEIRRQPMLYNIFDSHNEGIATGVEEMFMHAGLYDDSPRSREIVYIMVAQRAARGLGSLYAHANEMTMTEAGKIHSEYTPRGWMKTEKDLLIFEQHLYLRQPGYGTSYITGKYLIESLIAEYARNKEMQNVPFSIKEFLDKFNDTGDIPVSLAYLEMAGSDEMIRKIKK